MVVALLPALSRHLIRGGPSCTNGHGGLLSFYFDFLPMVGPLRFSPLPVELGVVVNLLFVLARPPFPQPFAWKSPAVARLFQLEGLPASSLSRASQGTRRRRPILMVGISFRFAAS